MPGSKNCMPRQTVSSGKTDYLLFSNNKNNDSIKSKFILRTECKHIKKINKTNKKSIPGQIS